MHPCGQNTWQGGSTTSTRQSKDTQVKTERVSINPGV